MASICVTPQYSHCYLCCVWVSVGLSTIAGLSPLVVGGLCYDTNWQSPMWHYAKMLAECPLPQTRAEGPPLPSRWHNRDTVAHHLQNQSHPVNMGYRFRHNQVRANPERWIIMITGNSFPKWYYFLGYGLGFLQLYLSVCSLSINCCQCVLHEVLNIQYREQHPKQAKFFAICFQLFKTVSRKCSAWSLALLYVTYKGWPLLHSCHSWLDVKLKSLVVSMIFPTPQAVRF